jgi:hypothetical protein
VAVDVDGANPDVDTPADLEFVADQLAGSSAAEAAEARA